MTKCRGASGRLLLTAVLAVGCAAGQKAPAGPSTGEPVTSAPAADEQDAESFEQALLDQEGVIVRELLPPAVAGADAEAALPASEAPTPQTAGAAPTACQTACKALASMRRAADGICRLTQDEPERCERARRRVSRATERVTSAGCVCDERE